MPVSGPQKKLGSAVVDLDWFPGVIIGIVEDIGVTNVFTGVEIGGGSELVGVPMTILLGVGEVIGEIGDVNGLGGGERGEIGEFWNE